MQKKYVEDYWICKDYPFPIYDIQELWVTESWDTQRFSYLLDMSLQSSLDLLIIFEKSVLDYMHNGIIIEL